MISVPDDVRAYMRANVADCNDKVAHDLACFPNMHEESLDLSFIAHFARKQGPIRFGSNWTLRFDAHYIGGGRHYWNWEVADLGLMVIFRNRGKIVRSKLAFLQSKKLYAHSLEFKPEDPYLRKGMGRLLVTEEEHQELVRPKILEFTEDSKYKALRVESEQQGAMSSFSGRHGVKVYYLFYNPSVIPWRLPTPIEEMPEPSANDVGCRVVPKPALDSALEALEANQSPPYRHIRDSLDGEFASSPHQAGWRLEYFINDLFIGCKEGLVDDSENFESMVALLSQKSAPIASALSITFDVD